MARRPPPRIEPTQADLQAAFKRKHWSHRYSFQEAMQDPVLSRALRMEAVAYARQLLRQQQRRNAAAGTHQQPAPAVRTTLHAPSHTPTFDRKRAAAGEREDD